LSASIEDLAQEFKSAIENGNANNNAPISLCGYSMGAAIAFEIAKLFEDEGRTCHVIMLDRGVSDHSKISGETQWNEVQTYLGEDALSTISSTALAQIKAAVIHYTEVISSYQPQGVINAGILALEAQENQIPNDMKQWEAFTRRELELRFVNSNHYSILSGENVEQISSFVTDFINKHSDHAQKTNMYESV
jgi:thioesterase domain-containing protein